MAGILAASAQIHQGVFPFQERKIPKSPAPKKAGIAESPPSKGEIILRGYWEK
jgi:hypothetical protein